jgi:hypothetical protein
VRPVAVFAAAPSAGRLMAAEAFAPEAAPPVAAAVTAAEAVAVREAPSAVRAEEPDSARSAVQRLPWVEYWAEHV